jgi:hypothetical protein
MQVCASCSAICRSIQARGWVRYIRAAQIAHTIRVWFPCIGQRATRKGLHCLRLLAAVVVKKWSRAYR